MQFRSLLIRLNFCQFILKKENGACPFFFKSSIVIMEPMRIAIAAMTGNSGMLGVGVGEEAGVGEVVGLVVGFDVG